MCFSASWFVRFIIFVSQLKVLFSKSPIVLRVLARSGGWRGLVVDAPDACDFLMWGVH